MSATGIGCTVYLDGVRIADGTPGDDPTAPTVLSGLSISWGRETTVDQPGAATAAFDLMDAAGGSSFITEFRTGRAITIEATGTTWDPPDTVAFLDPGFEGAAVGAIPPSYVQTGGVVVTAAEAHAGVHSALVTPADLAGFVTAAFAPAPWSLDPNAWDALPTTQAGQTWNIGASVRAPLGSQIEIAPVLFLRPYQGAGAPDWTVAATAVGTGDWLTLEFPYLPTEFGQWLGIAVRVSAFPSWAATPGTWAEAAGSWLDYGTVYVDDIVSEAPGGPSTQTVLVFAGRITDLTAGYDDDADAPIVSVTAADFTADLDNIDVGEEPWIVEAMGARFDRIVGLSGYPIDTRIDAGVAGTLVSYQDVDSQGVMGLLQDLAQTVDGVLWSAFHISTGAILWVEDTAARGGLYTLEESGGIVYIVPTSAGANALPISACDILRDPVEWKQDVADVSTRVAVSWLEQTVDDDGNPDTIEHTETLIDPDLEAEYGKRRIQVSTLLQSQPDARAIATRILARTHVTDWRASGVTIDDDDSITVADDAMIRAMLRLLDGTDRIGMPIRITDLPEWSPPGPTVPVFLEGGEYTFEDGAWTLALTVSRAASFGSSPAWAAMDPDWEWVSMDPEMTWVDLYGVTYPVT